MDSDSDSESKLISLISQLMPRRDRYNRFYLDEKQLSDIVQIVSLIGSLDLESQRKPESLEFISLIAQIKSVFKSMVIDSQPKPLFKLISRFTQLFLNPTNLVAPYKEEDSSDEDEDDLNNFVDDTLHLKPEPELISLIYKILSLITYRVMNPKDENLIFVFPKEKVRVGDDNILHIVEEFQFRSEYNKWDCLNMKGVKFRSGEGEGEGDLSYFLCRACYGQNHEKATDEIKYFLHPKHSLKLVWLENDGRERKCYCCDEYLSHLICCCFVCDFAMNMSCMEKPLVLSINRPKWHKHPLALFPRTTSLICDVCALVDSTCPIYICPPCGYVVHRKCIDLPHVIKISRHPQHRISFTSSFNQLENWLCGVCRKEIHHDYGGYSCTKNDCFYAAHSRCATQSNVWDGVELEGVPEEIEEELQSFVRISDGIIRHFSHQHHHMRLEDDGNREYDENKQCQACTMPIYSGNFYSCMQCNFILHEECANLSRKIHHPIHPHMLTLVGESEDGKEYIHGSCSACSLIYITGFFYKCDKEGCRFNVHVQCGTISEPLVHGSHKHPLFLTSKPGETRTCSVCKDVKQFCTNETFNCIECDFSLCFQCATIPQKVRYKHDKHMLSLSYGKDDPSTMASWCEVCEGKIYPEQRFYMCDEYCCVTLHVRCVIGKELYMKPGSSWLYRGRKVEVLPNNLHMSRPFCAMCRKRCTEKIVFKKSGFILCSNFCAYLYQA